MKPCEIFGTEILFRQQESNENAGSDGFLRIVSQNFKWTNGFSDSYEKSLARFIFMVSEKKKKKLFFLVSFVFVEYLLCICH